MKVKTKDLAQLLLESTEWHDELQDNVIHCTSVYCVAEKIMKLFTTPVIEVSKSSVCPRCKSEEVFHWVNNQIFECDDCNEQWQVKLKQ